VCMCVSARTHVGAACEFEIKCVKSLGLQTSTHSLYAHTSTIHGTNAHTMNMLTRSHARAHVHAFIRGLTLLRQLRNSISIQI
jgi:hypothetical protein